MRNAWLWLACLLATGSIQAQVKEKLDAYCKAAEASGKLHGVVLIKQQGQTLVSKSFGFANEEEKIAGTVNTRYQVGSVTKQFTSTIILKLVENGKISLKDKLARWYPKFPKANQVTIEHLLSHTSGIHNYTADIKILDSLKKVSVSEDFMVGLMASYPYDFEPGTKWLYSNSGYIFLGYIIQKVTKKSYEQCAREMIFQPLGMKSTGFDFKGATGSKAVGYYTITPSGNEKAVQVDSSVSYSAGALYTTPEDLAKWDASLYSGKIISVSAMMNAHTPRRSNYGLGWVIDTMFTKKVIHHGGGIDGFRSQNYIIPEDRVDIIVMMNAGDTDPTKIADDLVAIIAGKEPVSAPTTAIFTVSPSELEVYTGEYELAPGMVATFTVQDGKLLVDTHHDPIEELNPKAKDLFAFSSMDATLEFVKGTTGKVEKFVFRQGAMQREARKIR